MGERAVAYIRTVWGLGCKLEFGKGVGLGRGDGGVLRGDWKFAEIIGIW